MRSIFLILLLSLSFFVEAQRVSNPQKTYLNGKEFYDSDQFAMAAETFKQLTTFSNTYTEYATFFYGLSSYYNGKPEIAKNILLQLTRKSPNWEKNSEAYYWLGKIYFELGEYTLGLDQLDRINKGPLENDANNLKLYYLAQAPIEDLGQLYEKYPEDAAVAESYARALGQTALSKEEMDQLQELIDHFDLSGEEITNQIVSETEFKDLYNVAVCFPFLIDEVNTDRRQNSNQWVLDLYQGIQLAHEDLSAKNGNIELFAYDTERDSLKMSEILSLDEMNSMDLIIGPLYPAPSKLASAFAFNQKVNILNPLSTNSEVIAYNPYSFLYHPADDTQANKAADYMKDHLDKEKKALVIYGSRAGDSIAAFQYREVLQGAGIEVIMMDQIPTADSEQVAKFVSDNLYEIFTPLPDDPILLLVEENDDEDEEEEDDEDEFIPRSDLGHVFVASSNELVVANVIGTIDNMGPELTIMGNDRWLRSRYADFQQLERLQVHMAAPGFLNYDSDNFQAFQRKYQRKFGSVPNNYSFIGYDLMLFYGNMLNQAGTYFQNDFANNGFYPGHLFQGYDYQQGNDNAHIPIVRFENGILVQVNQ